MTTSNRAALLTKTHKVLKKHYKPVLPPADRSLLEHLLYACCLENAKYEAADETFAKLQQLYFDWNEVRVTTVTELAEVMGALPDPAAAAYRLKRSLQAVFESHYSFDLEFLKKQNLGKAVQDLQKYHGISDFGVAYVTQCGLGGHAIPVDQATLDVLRMLTVINEQEAQQHRVPGLERAIPKSQGPEFASLLHQLAADFLAAPLSPKLRSILVEIHPDAKDRLPKRAGGKKPEEKPEPAAGPAAQETAAAANSPPEEAAPPAGRPRRRKKSTKDEKPPAATDNEQLADKTEQQAAEFAEPTDGGPKKKTPAKRLAKKKPR